MAEASWRTFTASTARAGAPASANKDAASSMTMSARTTFKRRPPTLRASSLPPAWARAMTMHVGKLANFASISRLSGSRSHSAASKGKHDLADVDARFHARVCGRSLHERERAVDHRLHPPGREQRQDLVLDTAGD